MALVNRQAIAQSLITWTIAGLIALAFLLIAFTIHANEKKPCSERPCFIALDKRLAAIEAEMKARTADRYTGADARRDRELLQKELSDIRATINRKHSSTQP